MTLVRSRPGCKQKSLLKQTINFYFKIKFAPEKLQNLQLHVGARAPALKCCGLNCKVS